MPAKVMKRGVTQRPAAAIATVATMGRLQLTTELTVVVMLALVTSWTLPSAHAHSYHLGSCPQVPPTPGFVTRKFLGRWHVLQKTSTRVRCLTNEYSWASPSSAAIDGGREGGGGRSEWAEEAEEAASKGEVGLLQRMRLPLPGVNHEVHYTGELKPDPDGKRAGSFTARFPLNMLGSATYVVFDTDYDSYAGVFSCQKIALWHRLSASIMARGPSLAPSIVNKLRNQLRSYGINVDDLDGIRHTCDADDERGIQVRINPNVLNTNATEILRDANEVASTAADAAKRAYDVYNTVNGVYTGMSARRRREVNVANAHARKNESADDDGEATLRVLLQMQHDWMP